MLIVDVFFFFFYLFLSIGIDKLDLKGLRVNDTSMCFVPKSTECYRDVNLILYYQHVLALFAIVHEGTIENTFFFKFVCLYVHCFFVVV